MGLGVCVGECLVAPPWRTDGLAMCPRGVPSPFGGLALGTGVGRREMEQEGRRKRQRREGGRLLPWKELQGILGSEFSLPRTGDGGSGWLGKVMGKPVSFFCPWHVPASPQTEWSPHTPGAGPQQSPLCPACPPHVQKAEWPLPGGLFTSTTAAN